VDRGGIPDVTSRADRTGERKAGKRKRPAGLEIIERHDRWHLHGTIRVRKRSRRVRRSTDLPARPEFKEDAIEIKRQIEADFVNEVVYGIKPSIPLGIAARRYLGLNGSRRTRWRWA